MKTLNRGLGRKLQVAAIAAVLGGNNAQTLVSAATQKPTASKGGGRAEDAGDHGVAKGENRTGGSAAKRNGKPGKKAGVGIIAAGAKPVAKSAGSGSKDGMSNARSGAQTAVKVAFITSTMTGGQKAVANAGAFAQKAVARGQVSLASRTNGNQHSGARAS
jgi:hypothetical protein